MGCGCKNKGNNSTNQSTPLTQKEENQRKLEFARNVNEDVKDRIKKTIEKYYNKGKTQ